jgi:Notch-like protein
MHRLISLLLLVLTMLACSSPWHSDGESCPADVCSGHGTCTYQKTYPTCACAAGYEGMVCSSCATGYHRASDDTCVADEACAETTCANGGSCTVASGVAVCSCATGFAGARCDTCAPGFHSEQAESGTSCVHDESCLPSTCSGGGTCAVVSGVVSCACAEGRTGTWCEKFTGSCEASNPCSAHGTCNDSSGAVQCECALGFGGATCDTCYAGYSATEDGQCVRDEVCGPATCSFAGTCTVVSGLTQCSCDAGYSGTLCDECGTGYHRALDRSCAADDSCSPAQCGAHGACSVTGGVAGCLCDNGWAGPNCESCYPGYHEESDGSVTTCVLDTRCTPTTCRTHGTCSEDAGRVSCACDDGYSGDFCETSVDACASNACGSGTCVNQPSEPSGYVCLCSNGQWGSSCSN